MNIRIATAEDAKELLSIYKYYVENTTITFEYDTPVLYLNIYYYITIF